MKLSMKAMGISCGLLWSACILFGGAAHLLWPSYGNAFLQFAASIYPGYNPDGGIFSVLVGTVYGFADAGIGGALLAWLYNRISG